MTANILKCCVAKKSKKKPVSQRALDFIAFAPLRRYAITPLMLLPLRL
jgi:hypothetical protein